MALGRGRRRSVQAALCCLLVGLPQPSWASVYHVRQGDWLAHILRDHQRQPVWGARGTLAQTLKLNPHITDPNCIRPGQVIVLPGPGPGPAPGRAAGGRGKRRPYAASQTPPAAKAGAPPAAGRSPAGSAVDPGAATPLCAAAPQATAPIAACPPCAAGTAGSAPGAQPGPRLEARAGPAYLFSRLVSQDLATRREASLASQSGIGADIRATAIWPQGVYVLGTAALHGLAFRDPSGGQASLQNGSALLWRAMAGVGIEPLRRLRAEVLVGALNGLFVTAQTTNRVALRSAVLGSVELGVGATPWQTGPWQLNVDLHARVYQGPTWVARGLGWEARLGALRRLGPRLDLEAALAYGQRRQGTGSTAQAEDTLTLQLGLGWGVRAVDGLEMRGNAGQAGSDPSGRRDEGPAAAAGATLLVDRPAASAQ